MSKHDEIMKQVFAHMDGFVVVDHKSYIVFVEENYAKSQGFDPHQVVGRYIKEIIPKEPLNNSIDFLRGPNKSSFFVNQHRF